mmetsp:Transcript_4812/g.13148  ORF Transcript_4812/g.13148 Transcript_4812/m.13148 type:complete len:215 (+) Transcript_4812:3045-3689(+)
MYSIVRRRWQKAGTAPWRTMAPQDTGSTSAMKVRARAARSIMSGLWSALRHWTSIGTELSMGKDARVSSEEMDSTSQSSVRAPTCADSSSAWRRLDRMALNLLPEAIPMPMMSSNPAPSFLRSPCSAVLALFMLPAISSSSSIPRGGRPAISTAEGLDGGWLLPPAAAAGAVGAAGGAGGTGRGAGSLGGCWGAGGSGALASLLPDLRCLLVGG